MLARVLFWVVVIFPVSELILALTKRARVGTARESDKGSLLGVYLAVAAGLVLALLLQRVPVGRLPAAPQTLAIVALVLLLAGLALRWAAIVVLGRFFTVDVAIHPDHRVVQTGPYRFMRHPSYTGLLMEFLGLGVFFGSWLSILALLVPITLAVLNRVAKEEEALHASLGAEYDAYCARTKRFVPGIV